MAHRIVVCDDDTHITRAVQMKLSRAGFEVETGSDGQMAWEAIQREIPDMLITDYQMPRLTGLELAARVRATAALRNLPVVLLTAKGFELDENQLQEEFGFHAVLTKPFSPRELLQLVENTIQRTDAAPCCDVRIAESVNA